MNIDLISFDIILPSQDSHEAKTQRDRLWELWDKNQNGFMSLNEMGEGICESLNLELSENIKQIVRKSSDDVKRRFHIQSKLGMNFIQKKEFRSFLQCLHKHATSLKIFQSLDKNKDNRIEEDELMAATQILIKWDIPEDQKMSAKKLTYEKKLTFNKFEEWLDSCQYYDVRDVKSI